MHAIVVDVDLDAAVSVAEPTDRLVRHGPGHASPLRLALDMLCNHGARGAGAARDVGG